MRGPGAAAPPACAWIFFPGQSSPRFRLSRQLSRCSGYIFAGSVAFPMKFLFLATRGRGAMETWSGGHCRRNVRCPGTRSFTRSSEPSAWASRSEPHRSPSGRWTPPEYRSGLTHETGAMVCGWAAVGSKWPRSSPTPVFSEKAPSPPRSACAVRWRRARRSLAYAGSPLSM